MPNLVGNGLVQNEVESKREILLVITEHLGNILINGRKLDQGYNVDGSIRLFTNVRSELNLHTCYFQASPEMHPDASKSFLYSFWEDYAVAKYVVHATVIITKMDYESGYDSFS